MHAIIILLLTTYIIKISSLKSNLLKLNTQLHLLSKIDPLTHIANRRSYEERLIEEVQSCYRTASPLCLVMIDVDHFKEYNDGYGHAKGDTVLTSIAKSINESLNRTTDFVARYGGEEFVVLLPHTPLDGAIDTAEIIKDNIQKLNIEHNFVDNQQCLSISLGIAILDNRKIDKYELLNRADEALYEAKKLGRNRVEVYKD